MKTHDAKTHKTKLIESIARPFTYLIILSVAMAGCDDNGSEPNSNPAPTPQEKSFAEGNTETDDNTWEYVQSDEFEQDPNTTQPNALGASVQAEGVTADMALDSLAKYLQGSARLRALLSGSAEYTLFAPSNAAWVNFMQAASSFLPETPLPAVLIEKALSYHIVTGLALQANLRGNLKTQLASASIEVDAEGKLVSDIGDGRLALDGLTSGRLSPDASVTSPNRKTSNGVVHVVNSILIPDSVFQDVSGLISLTAESETNQNTWLYIGSDKFKEEKTEDPNMSLDSLAKYLEGSATLKALLEGESKYTLFAPSNTAFTKFLQIRSSFLEDGAFPDGLIEKVLSYHIVKGVRVDANLEGAVTTQLGASITVDVEGKLVSDIGNEGRSALGAAQLNPDATITSSNRITQNGVVHVIDGVMISESAYQNLLVDVSSNP